MNSKTLLVCLVILALAVFSAQGLTIQKRNHKKQMHRVKTFTQHLCNQMHFDDAPSDAAAGDDSWVMDLMTFVMGDPDILDSVMNSKPLSAESAQKLKNFLSTSQSFKKFAVQQYSADGSPDCLKNLSDEQKERLFEIQLGHIDFGAMLNASSDSAQGFTDDQNKQIQDDITSDDLLGDDVAQCYSDNGSFFSSAQ